MVSEFGDFLRTERKRLGLTLREAAKLAGVSHNRLVEVERGLKYSTAQRTLPSRELLERIAVAYGLSLEPLLSMAGYPVGEVSTLSSEAQQMVSVFEPLSAHQKRVALDLLRVLAQHDKGDRGTT